MSQRIVTEEFVGRKFGLLTVICKSQRRTKARATLWTCECACGNITTPTTANLINGNSTNCGCVRKLKNKARSTTHGRTRTLEYSSYRRMLDRCLNSESPQFRYYGGRGITVCDRWIASVENFIEDVGPRPSKDYTIERIDSDGNYDPSNCRWATRKEQSRNIRTNRMLTFNGESRCIAEWAEIRGMSPTTIIGRINRGWSITDALSIPVSKSRFVYGRK